MSLKLRFELRDKVGEGAMSEVFEAYDRNLRRHVAIKLFKGFGRGGIYEEAQQRFLVDARAAARLTHPNIVTIHDVGHFGDGIAIVMELAKESLRKMLDRNPRLPWDTISGMGAQIAEGLKCLHGEGILHRDIKPSNILIAPGDFAKIGDFGLAHLPMSDLTRTGTVIGTPKYMSPEQAQGQDLDCRTDIFSLGVVLFEMLTGQTPFGLPFAADHVLLGRIINETAMKPSQLNPLAPAVFDGILSRALAKRPQDRYPDAGEFAAALRNCRIE